jgi:hypothetical protein
MALRTLLTFCIILTCSMAQFNTQYDVLIIGGGPSGLSAASGLARVLRKIALFDSGEYRNKPTRHMHDVIGSDRMFRVTYLSFYAQSSASPHADIINQMLTLRNSAPLPVPKYLSTMLPHSLTPRSSLSTPLELPIGPLPSPQPLLTEPPTPAAR